MEAISSAVPSRPIFWRETNFSRPSGPAAAARSSIEGVSTVPGQMLLQRIPCVMKSSATARVSSETAFIDVGSEHGGALTRECDCASPPDARRRGGDDGALSLQSIGHFLFSLFPFVIARSPCDEAIHTSGEDRWIASLRSQ